MSADPDQSHKDREMKQGETDTKQAACSFLREEADAVAPPKGEKTGKESARVR
jgi:hypothetical protein